MAVITFYIQTRKQKEPAMTTVHVSATDVLREAVLTTAKKVKGNKEKPKVSLKETEITQRMATAAKKAQNKEEVARRQKTKQGGRNKQTLVQTVTAATASRRPTRTSTTAKNYNEERDAYESFHSFMVYILNSNQFSNSASPTRTDFEREGGREKNAVKRKSTSPSKELPRKRGRPRKTK